MPATATVLASTEVVEEPQRKGKYSKIEGEILVLMRRPVRFQQTIKEILYELAPLFSEYEVWKGLLNLVEDGMIRPAYTSGYEVGVEQA